jgi:hypothetical protein
MWLYRILSLTGLLAVTLAESVAAPPLHRRIDDLIEAHPGFDRTAMADATDAEFLRRVHLDLTGTIPSADVVREFLANTTDDKRTQVVDALLHSPEYARRMQYVFDVMLMERGADKHVPAAEWRAYLRRSFAENRPWDELVAEMLSADGTDPTTRPAAKFLLDRELKVDEVTRDLGRIFLGRDLQCAQCHDHPNVDDYLQRHYYGLTAFVNRSHLFKDPKTGVTSIGEKAEGDVEFTSVFTNESGGTAPRMLDLPPLVDPPVGDERYAVKPVKNVRAVPLYSRRLQLATAMTDDANRAFRRNIANRLWRLMLGRGLVEPLDMWHAGNPPSHPELLDLLADDLMEHDYDVRHLLRELALTRTYQRSGLQPAGGDAAERTDFSAATLKPLSPEQLAWSMMQATGVVDRARARLKAAREDAKAKSDAAAEKDLTLDDVLRDEINTFATVFGTAGTQTSQFDAAADQALFLRNGSLIQDWIALDDGLCERLQTMENAPLAEELYLAVLSRPPSAEETAGVEDYLDHGEDRDAAVRQLVWAMLVSAEFRFNH